MTWAFKLRPRACALKLSRVKEGGITGATGAAGAIGATGATSAGMSPFPSAGSMMQLSSQERGTGKEENKTDGSQKKRQDPMGSPSSSGTERGKVASQPCQDHRFLTWMGNRHRWSHASLTQPTLEWSGSTRLPTNATGIDFQSGPCFKLTDIERQGTSGPLQWAAECPSPIGRLAVTARRIHFASNLALIHQLSVPRDRHEQLLVCGSFRCALNMEDSTNFEGNKVDRSILITNTPRAVAMTIFSKLKRCSQAP